MQLSLPTPLMLLILLDALMLIIVFIRLIPVMPLILFIPLTRFPCSSRLFRLRRLYRALCL